MIKIEPFQLYAVDHAPAICYVGIRSDESDGRTGSDHSGLNGITQDFPLVRWGWGINEVLKYLRELGVRIPSRTDCDCCFYQRIGEWWRLWRDHREKWMELEALELWTGHTFRSEARDSWPAGLRELRSKFEAGFIPNGAAQETMDMDVATRPLMCAWCAR